LAQVGAVEPGAWLSYQAWIVLLSSGMRTLSNSRALRAGWIAGIVIAALGCSRLTHLDPLSSSAGANGSTNGTVAGSLGSQNGAGAGVGGSKSVATSGTAGRKSTAPSSGTTDAGASGNPGQPSGPDACKAAGGRCVLGGFPSCATVGPQDCNPDRNPGGAFCCLKDVSATCGDAGVLNIQASDYDQTCASDTDCVAISQGNACEPCTLECTTAAISKSAEGPYQVDIAKAHEGDAGVGVICHCPLEFPACCLAGKCHADSQCSATR
jgi:hypothetical protein